jgi:tRNA pseudouridine55 synthase
VTCSAGTYIRVLAADLGTRLGGGAHLRNLRRTRVGSFTQAEARPLEEVGPDDIMSPADAVRDLARVTVDPEVAGLVAMGRPLDKVPLGAPGDGPWALVDADVRLLAIYEGTGTDRIRPLVVLEAR